MSTNTALHRLTKEKGNELYKFLGIDSGVPSTQIIADMKKRQNNPLFKLSIEDYQQLRENNVMKRMMAKAIGCDIKQFNKFCKYVNVFIENIESSPDSIKKKMNDVKNKKSLKLRGNLYVLPEEVLEKIIEKYKTIFKIKYVLKRWVPVRNLDWNFLSMNPNAIELLKKYPKKINWKLLSFNTNAIGAAGSPGFLLLRRISRKQFRSGIFSPAFNMSGCSGPCFSSRSRAVP